jgi:hypothetical protein
VPGELGAIEVRQRATDQAPHALAGRGAGNGEHRRPDDGEERGERMHRPEDPLVHALLENREERLRHHDPGPSRVGVEMAPRLDELAQHHAGEGGVAQGLVEEAADEGGELGGGPVAGGADGLHAGAEGGEGAADGLAVEGVLAVEVVVDHRLVEAGFPGDAVDAGAGEAVGGELPGGGGEEAGAGIGAGGGARATHN